ncbi:MerR family transcriptional regulator [Chloroflexia bacterium SDU3-3]|nr:MerR family transcriptional regulator [Chloroflexia bacterium SDU3-3]
MEELSIGAVARRARVQASTIRYYEQIGLLPAPERVGGQRRYGADVLDRLAFIRTAQRIGFSLGEVQQLLDHQRGGVALPALWRTLAQQKLGEIDRVIQHAQQIRQQLSQGLGCACDDLGSCMQCVCAECGAGGGC